GRAVKRASTPAPGSGIQPKFALSFALENSSVLPPQKVLCKNLGAPRSNPEPSLRRRRATRSKFRHRSDLWSARFLPPSLADFWESLLSVVWLSPLMIYNSIRIRNLFPGISQHNHYCLSPNGSGESSTR